jgi:hypothetical protein
MRAVPRCTAPNQRRWFRVPVPRSSMLVLATLALAVGAMVPGARPASASSFAETLVATYDTDLHLRWATRVLRVKTRIDVANEGTEPVHRLDLNTLAAKLGGMRDLRVRVNGVEVIPPVSGQTIRVSMPTPLAPDATARVDVSYRARLRTTTSGRDFLWARVGGIAHIYRFIPWISRRIPYGPTMHGEPFMTGVSPFVRVDVDSDRPLVWATSGQRSGGSGDTSTFIARDVRDFNIAASPGYRTKSTQSKDGRVRIVAHTSTLDAGRILRLARAELDRFQRFTGILYPYPVYRIAESGGGLAMESPAMAWIPRGRTVADQAFLVSHETAHQWFYAIVGNDQATDAFADEGMAEYLSRTARGFLRASRCRLDRLDKSIHGYRPGCYYETIYVQGALFLDGLRKDFGDKPFRRAIRHYAKDNAFGMGSDRRLLEAFRDEMGNKVLKRYRQRFPSLY